VGACAFTRSSRAGPLSIDPVGTSRTRWAGGTISARLTDPASTVTGFSWSLPTVTTAAVTNAFVEAASRRRGAHADDTVLAELTRLRAELEQLRAALLVASGDDAPRAGPGGAAGSEPSQPRSADTFARRQASVPASSGLNARPANWRGPAAPLWKCPG